MTIGTKKLSILAAACVGSLLAATSQAAVLYSFRTDKSTGGAYNDSFVETTAAANVSGPTAGELINGVNGLIRFHNDQWAAFSLIGDGTTTIEDFNTTYFTFTVEAEGGQLLNLDSLDFNSARGNTTNTRYFEIYAAVNGAAFDAGTDLILDVNSSGDAGTRASPAPFSVDLTGAKFQNISSVTFRYYPQTSNSTSTIEFDGMKVMGTTAVPEPATVTLGGAAGLLLLLRRRRMDDK